MLLTLLKSFIAVGIGNAIYFLLVYPHVSAAWRHQPRGGIDAGLALDFAICLALYLVVRAIWPDKRREEEKPRA